MTRSCSNCQREYEIIEKDLEFYDKLSTALNGRKFPLPAPTLCPQCRHQRRLGLRNERFLYKRSCDLCQKDVISVFPAESEYTVYCSECWWSDRWDPFSYGKEYDSSRSFFEQFHALEKSFPHTALFQDGTSENSEYTNFGGFNKSCYMALCVYCEEVYYSHNAFKSKSSMDCEKLVGSQFCYECVDCHGCYNLFFSQDCQECSESYFLQDCRQSSNCFASSGLRNKQYVFENQQLTKEEYEKRMQEISFTNANIEMWKKRLREISASIPKKYIHGNSNENVTGDYIDQCRNLEECYDCLGVQDCKYCDSCGIQSKDLFDITNIGLSSELCYEVNGGKTLTRCKFIYYCNDIHDSEYSQYCYSSKNIFGCIGLRHKEYCILNKQYTKEEYEKLLPQIIEEMSKTGQYGEYFPLRFSPFAYNETVAQEYYPLTKEQAVEKEYGWKEVAANFVPQNVQVPERIGDVSDEIVRGVLACMECSRNFKIIAQELKLYRQWSLPIPQKCPECRHKNRFAQRNPRKLWSRNCMKCEKPLQTSYAPERPEIVYCEECYLGEMY